MVKFETITGREINLDVKLDSTFRQIKETLSAQNNWEIQQIHLLFDGSDLEDNMKLSTVNLDGGRRFIVIYVEPTGEVPDVDNMINMLLNFQPDRKLCFEVLQKYHYNIEQATDYLISQIDDTAPVQAPASSSSHISNNTNSSEGRIVQPESNQFHYTPPSQQPGNYNLTEDERKTVLKYKPPDMDESFAFELFLDVNKNIESFRELL